MAVRQTNAGESEPIVTRQRRALEDGGAARVNLTKVGCDALGIEPGDDLDVELYDDHIRVKPER